MTMRSTIFQALANDSQLNVLGLTSGTMFHNYNLTSRPVDDSVFGILRWGRQPIRWGKVKGPLTLTLWVHAPLEVSNDHSLLESVLDRCDIVLGGLEAEGGVGFVQPLEHSDDHNDQEFQTISKYSQYTVLTQQEAA